MDITQGKLFLNNQLHPETGFNLPTAFGTPEGCNGGYFKNLKPADGNILGNPQQDDGQSKKYISGIIGMGRDRPGVPKGPKK